MGAARAKKWARRAAMALGGLLLFLAAAVGALFIWLGTESSRNLLLGIVAEALEGQGLYLKVESSEGQLPFDLQLKGVSLADSQGVWLSLPSASIELSPFKLFGLVAQLDALRLEGLNLSRLPVLLPAQPDGAGPGAQDEAGKGISLPIDIRVHEFALLGAGVEPELLAALVPERREAVLAMGRLGLSLHASAVVQRGAIMEPGNITLEVKSDFELPEGSALSLTLFTGPERGLPDRLRLELLLSEAERGILAAFSGLEKLPAYSLRLASESSLSDIALDVQLKAERLAAVSGHIGLVPLGSGGLRRQDSLARLLSPNWQADIALKAEPGPLLAEAGSPFALPQAALELAGKELELALKAQSDISDEVINIDILSLTLENSSLRAGVEEALVGLSPAAGGGRRLACGGAIVAEIRDGDFFAALGPGEGAPPILDKATLRLAALAALDLPGSAPGGESGAGALKADFDLKGPLTLESRHPLLAGAAAPLEAHLELAGAYGEALTLDVLRLSGLGLELDGRARAVFEPLLASLDVELGGERAGQWNKILTGLNGNIPETGLKASLTARLDQRAAKAGDEARAQLKLALTDCAWPMEELQKGLGPYLGLLAHFSGPLASPYTLTLDGIISGPEPVEPAAYEPGWSGGAFAGLRARGGAHVSLPGATPGARLTGLEARLDWALGDMGLFLPEGTGLSGPLRGFASAKGLAGGDDTAISLNAWLGNYSAEYIQSPIGSLVLGTEANAELNMRGGLSLVGQILLNADSDKAGSVIFNSDLAVKQPEGQALSLAVKNLDASFAGLSLAGNVDVTLPPDAAPPPPPRPPFSTPPPPGGAPPATAPRLEGKLQAHFENWQGLHDILKRLELGVPPITGTPLDLTVELDPAAEGQAVSVNLRLDEFFMFMDSGESWWRLPKPEESSALLARHGMVILHGLGGRVDVADLWGQRLVSGHLKTDAGSVDVESWQSLALFLDLAGNVGRVNLAVRGDAGALDAARALDENAPPFSAELVASYLNGKAAAPKASAEAAGEAATARAGGAKAEAGLSDAEMASLSGMFRLDPLGIYLERAALYAPEFETGFYLASPAIVRVADDISIENVHFAILPAGHLKADAYFSAQSSRAVADIKDLPLGLIRKLANVPMPEGELSLTSRLDRRGLEISGDTELTALLRPAYQNLGSTGVPLILRLKSGMSKESGEFKLPTGPGIARITGSGTLGEAPSGDVQARPEEPNMRLAFDIPCRVNQQGIVLPDYQEPMAASLSWRGELGRFWYILPVSDRYLSGMAQLDFKLGGKLARLEYGGSAYLANGRYEDRIVGLMLTGMNLEALLGGQGTRLSLSAGDGEEGKIALEAKLDDTGIINTGLGGGPGFTWPGLAARAQINHLAPLHRDDLYIRLSGLLDASGPLLSPLVEGKFEIEQGILNLMASLGGGVTTLPVEERSDDELVQVPKQSAMLDISVEAPRRFYVRGPGLDSEWRASATVTGPADSPIFSATISPVRGYFDLLSRPFAFTSGQVEVWGSGDYLDSNLDLVLTHSRADITAEINAKGSIKRPKLELGSTPPLPQDQILAQVLFGKDITQLSAIEAVQVANGVRQLMSFGQGGFDLMGGVRDLLGVDTLRIGSSGGGQQSGNISGSPDASAFGVGGGEQAESNPTVEAGKYINDSIYVGVEQGTTESSTRVRVEVELKPNLTLQGSSGTDSSQVGLGWKRDY